jgi:hypothetical protein
MEPRLKSEFVLADQPGIAFIILGSLIVIYFAVRFARRTREKQRAMGKKIPQTREDRSWL